MPRPPKAAQDTRDYSIELRVTFAEKTTIKKNAKDHGLTMSDFLRVRAIEAKQPVRRIPNADREALLQYLAEFNKQGSNLNQIARVLNMKTNDEIIDYGLIVKVDNAVERFEQSANHIMELLQW